ncbi:cellulase family glycosylhydrolase [Mycobacterium sp. E740]|uniref:cellulase family glycosylhydrolase n=1 Tax=Mycobacterium sp. E740 TaxID=1834149 RepID=UPI0007FED90C|nr:cellulase family glycosylhydrolase [Mycobacterium sp. E740]OBI74859.1 beta-galactosidase [Mycobacterium sp. E740]
MTHRIRGWGLLLLLLFSLLPLSCASPVRAVGTADIGMSVRMGGTDPATVARQFDLMAQMKVKWVRTDFDWSWIEQNRGQFDWGYPDLIVKEASARGMKVLALLTYTPAWAREPNTTSHAPPADAAQFAAFAAAAAERYARRGVRHWEIWNEPNAREFWEPKPDADRYGELFGAAAAAVRKVDPDATLLTGGLTRGGDAPDGSLVSQTTYLERLYGNGTAQQADAVAVHPYSFPFLPMQPNQEIGGFRGLPEVHDLMSRHGDGDKKIWITEFGAPTGTGPAAVSEDAQAEAIVQAREQVQGWSWAGPLFYFELRDGGDDRGDLHQNFGVLHRDLRPKLSGEALLD